MFTIQEVFVKTGIPENKLYYEIRKGRIKTTEKYGKILISKAEVDRLIQEEEERRRNEGRG